MFNRSSVKAKCPQNFIPGLTQPRLSDDGNIPQRSDSPISYDRLKDSTTTEKLFIRAGLLGLLTTPNVHDSQAGNMLKNADYNKQPSCNDVRPPPVVRRATVSDCLQKNNDINNRFIKRQRSRTAVESVSKDIQNKNITSKDIQNKNITSKDIPISKSSKKDIPIRNRSKTEIDKPTKFLSLPPESENNFVEGRLSSTNSSSLPDLDNITNLCDEEGRLLDIPKLEKRRSRSFSSGINYLHEEKVVVAKRKISRALVRRAVISHVEELKSREESNKVKERATMSVLQTQLRSKLPKTFQATASMGLFDPTIFNDAKRQSNSHKEKSPANTHPVLRGRVNSLPWFRGVNKNESGDESPSGKKKLFKKMSSSPHLFRRSQQHRELENIANARLKQKKNSKILSDSKENIAPESKETISKTMLQDKKESTPKTISEDKKETASKEVTSGTNSAKGDDTKSSSFYFSRHRTSSVKNEVEVVKKRGRRVNETDRYSNSSTDSGINIQNNCDSSEEENTIQLEKESILKNLGDVPVKTSTSSTMSSLKRTTSKTVFLTPTDGQRKSSTSSLNDAKSRKVSISKSVPFKNTEQVKMRRSNRKISIGKPPAVNHVSLKIERKVGLVKFAPSKEKPLVRKCNSLPKRPHSYLREIRDEISKELCIESHHVSATLPSRVKVRKPIPQGLFEQGIIEDSNEIKNEKNKEIEKHLKVIDDVFDIQ